MENNFKPDNNIIDMTETTKDTYTAKRKARRTHPVAKKIGVFVLSGTLFGAAAGGAFTGTSYLTKNTTTNTTNSQVTSTEESGTASLTTSNNSGIKATNTYNSTSTNSTLSVSDIATNCMPSIVAITNVGVTDVMTMWGTMQQESESCGSGVIIGKTDSELLIVTNYHVIESSNTLTVVFSYDEDSSNASDGPNAVEAYIKGYDEDKDLAVIAISMDNLSQDVLDQISIATVGSSDDLVLGEQVVAIGNALGYGQSVTTGIVSALNRTISTSSTDGTTSDDSNKYIQTDAAINPGNSGGALFNMNGELVGINSAKIASSEVEGMGYAIPISDVYDLIQELMNETTRTDVVAEENRGYLGITGNDVTSDISSAYGFPEGVYVSSVTEGSAADNAGIVKGNIITKFDGKTVSSLSQLQNLLTYYSAGETVTMTLQVAEGSSYTEKEISVTLSSAEEAGITTSNSTNNGNTQNNESGFYDNQNNNNDSSIYNYGFGGLFR